MTTEFLRNIFNLEFALKEKSRSWDLTKMNEFWFEQYDSNKSLFRSWQTRNVRVFANSGLLFRVKDKKWILWLRVDDGFQVYKLSYMGKPLKVSKTVEQNQLLTETNKLI